MLTGKATELMVASRAVARLTMAIEVKEARSRHPRLNFSTSSASELDFYISIAAEGDVTDGSIISSVPFVSMSSGLLSLRPAVSPFILCRRTPR